MASYVVKSGDTLSGIAVRFGTTLNAILGANPQFRANPNLIYPGQTVTIPTTSSGAYQEPSGEFVTSNRPVAPAASPSSQYQIGPNGELIPVFPTAAPTATGTTPPAIPSQARTTPTTTNPVAPVGATGATTSPAANQVPGVVTFIVPIEGADGTEFVTTSVYFPPSVWQALIGSAVDIKYGLSAGLGENGIPQIPPGQLENFKRDVLEILPPDLDGLFNEKMATVDTVTGGVTTGDFPPLSPAMIESGITYGVDPLTGEITLVDTKPLVGPPIASWQFTITDPTNPSVGQWTLVADPSDVDKLYEGVPDAVRPWLQAALDAGGDTSMVPEGPTRAWVEFVLGQAQGSSARQPDEIPFGVGLPNFSPTGLSGGTTSGEGAAAPGSPTGTGVSTTRPPTFPAVPADLAHLESVIQGQRMESLQNLFNQNLSDLEAWVAGNPANAGSANAVKNIFPNLQGFANNALPNLVGFAGSLEALRQGGSIGVDLTGDTPAAQFYNKLIADGTLRVTGGTPDNQQLAYALPPATPNGDIPGVTTMTSSSPQPNYIEQLNAQVKADPSKVTTTLPSGQTATGWLAALELAKNRTR